MQVRSSGRIAASAICLLLAAPLAGCVSVAEYRKLERDVRSMKTRDGGGSAGREQMADLAARMDSLETELRRLRGQIEVSEHKATSALDEARKARRDAGAGLAGPVPGTEDAAGPPQPASSDEPAPLGSAEPSGGPTGSESTAGPSTAIVARAEPVAPDASPPASAPGASGEEVTAYRSAFAAWQRNDADACIDQFRQFTKNYPSSIYADDAAYWMADCFYKKGDYKLAVMRFDDVVARYPKGNKAADALYRHGESLLKMGPAYQKAARRAFERVTQEYPDSPRSAEAEKQISALDGGSGSAKRGATAEAPAVAAGKDKTPARPGQKPASKPADSNNRR